MASLEDIEQGAELGKYRVDERVRGGDRALFDATITESGKPVSLLELTAEEAAALSKASGVRHAHLARVHEVLTHGDASLLVFERVAGTTLTALLLEIRKKPQVDAVRSALRVSDALSHLHEAGSVHGFINTDSVLLDPPERLGPVLSFAPIAEELPNFRCPERGENDPPSVADDAWAMAGLTHMMLSGDPPPETGYASEDDLASAGIEDPALRAALLHGLNQNADARSHDVRPLKRELARWFVEHAGEEPVSAGPHSTQPPPLPAGPGSVAPASLAASRRPQAPRRRSRFGLFAIVGTLAGLAIAGGYSAWRSRTLVKLVERPAPAVAPAEAKAIDLSEVPVTGEEQSAELDKAASCVASYLPKGAFGKSPELAWLCEESDAQKGAQKLRVAIVTAAPKGGPPTRAMKVFARIGWYDLAAYAVVRAGCCEEPKPLTLPDPSQGCDSMAEALRELGKEVVAGKSYDEPLKHFAGAIHCELNLGHGQPFGRTQRPQAGEDSAFKEFIEAIQH